MRPVKYSSIEEVKAKYRAEGWLKYCLRSLRPRGRTLVASRRAELLVQHYVMRLDHMNSIPASWTLGAWFKVPTSVKRP